MGTAAFVALLMALWNQRDSATQYALLSSLASLGRIFIAPSSGFLAAAVGWPFFFIIATLTAVPGLIMLIALKKEIAQYQSEHVHAFSGNGLSTTSPGLPFRYCMKS